jgi:hypothetical protein
VKLIELETKLIMALQAQGFAPYESIQAAGAAIVKCLPSYQALLTLALESAADARKADDPDDAIEWEAPPADDISF